MFDVGLLQRCRVHLGIGSDHGGDEHSLSHPQTDLSRSGGHDPTDGNGHPDRGTGRGTCTVHGGPADRRFG
jgi:hypothetical protein